MNNKLIDTAVVAYQLGNEQAFTALYRDWLCDYLKAFVANASPSVADMDSADLTSLAHSVAAYAVRTWKPDAGACFKTWLCRLWRQRVCNAIQSSASYKAISRRHTTSLDQLVNDGDCELHEIIADSATASPADIVMALELVEQFHWSGDRKTAASVVITSAASQSSPKYPSA